MSVSHSLYAASLLIRVHASICWHRCQPRGLLAAHVYVWHTFDNVTDRRDKMRAVADQEVIKIVKNGVRDPGIVGPTALVSSLHPSTYIS